ncbi:unnamed protein product [Brassicogethes aeneus]|uniref:Platelet-derived growth factor (PDGF) family profile domain-containing protein n=1 Tax=Brassicogethes aeneus TaxID=1431903 RepID=A0A9P0B912_BRAAE|nr:unnamed protein product [Brassicogethes aeneus]
MAVLIYGCLCIPVNENYKKFREHQSYLTNFTCGVPRPRLIKSSTILKEKTNVREISPEYTVLYQCDCTGLCSSPGEICRAKTEYVKLYFRLQLSNVIISHDVRNATSCTCDKVKETPDCQMDIL